MTATTGTTPYSYSPFAMLLPFIEQSPLVRVDQLQPAEAAYQAGNTTAMATVRRRVPLPFRCSATVPAGEAGTNYRFSEGTTIAYKWGATDPTGYNAALPAPTGRSSTTRR